MTSFFTCTSILKYQLYLSESKPYEIHVALQLHIRDQNKKRYYAENIREDNFSSSGH